MECGICAVVHCAAQLHYINWICSVDTLGCKYAKILKLITHRLAKFNHSVSTVLITF